jgi:hypothetical protein
VLGVKNTSKVLGVKSTSGTFATSALLVLSASILETAIAEHRAAQS